MDDKLVLELGTVLVSIGDPVASIFGITYKNHPLNISYIKGKSMFGTLAGAFAVYSVTSLFIWLELGSFVILKSMNQYELFIVSLIINTSSELFPSDRDYCVDDNMTIPVAGGILYKCYFMYAGF